MTCCLHDECLAQPDPRGSLHRQWCPARCPSACFRAAHPTGTAVADDRRCRHGCCRGCVWCRSAPGAGVGTKGDGRDAACGLAGQHLARRTHPAIKPIAVGEGGCVGAGADADPARGCCAARPDPSLIHRPWGDALGLDGRDGGGDDVVGDVATGCPVLDKGFAVVLGDDRDVTETGCAQHVNQLRDHRRSRHASAVER